MEEAQIKIIGQYRYYMNKCLGEGSFGKVYEGYHENTKERLAVKTMEFQDFQQSNYLQQAIMSEISILSKIRSPFVVEFKEVLSSKRRLYIITQFCEGGDLKEYLAEKGRLSEQEAWKIISHLLQGFTSLLQHKVIHRDMKPANVLISNQRFKICDFGFAKNVENFGQQMLRTIVGSPLYMAPQLLSKSKYTTKCDIWSLGIIWYEMIAGNTPWPAKSDVQLLERIRRQKLKFDPKYFGAKTVALIRRMLVDEEDKRISWKQLMQEFSILERVVERKPVFNRIAQDRSARWALTSNSAQEDLQIRHFVVAELCDLVQRFKKNPQLASETQKIIFLVSLSAVRKSQPHFPQHHFITQTHLSLRNQYWAQLQEQKRPEVLNDQLNRSVQSVLRSVPYSRLHDVLVWLNEVTKGRPMAEVLWSADLKEKAQSLALGREQLAMF